MEVDLTGQAAAIAGAPGSVHAAVTALLEANGAAVSNVNTEADILTRVHLDVLVNVALGIDDWAHLEGLCRAAAERMNAPGGRILNIVSAAGAVPVRGELRSSVDAAAILALTRSLALELGSRRIRVNALAVGAVAGGVQAERLLSHVPLGRPGTAAEIAHAALFLVDPENSYTTGHVMLVDGGWAAGYARDF